MLWGFEESVSPCWNEDKKSPWEWLVVSVNVSPSYLGFSEKIIIQLQLLLPGNIQDVFLPYDIASNHVRITN